MDGKQTCKDSSSTQRISEMGVNKVIANFLHFVGLMYLQTSENFVKESRWDRMEVRIWRKGGWVSKETENLCLSLSLFFFKEYLDSF
jgi:hypothetical protein